uniref:Uncharacterized protein n=1 Tax=Rhizophora mucronata TaxID=61149 RepID=A0A2P2NQS3_RHIMU
MKTVYHDIVEQILPFWCFSL